MHPMIAAACLGCARSCPSAHLLLSTRTAGSDTPANAQLAMGSACRLCAMGLRVSASAASLVRRWAQALRPPQLRPADEHMRSMGIPPSVARSCQRDLLLSIVLPTVVQDSNPLLHCVRRLMSTSAASAPMRSTATTTPCLRWAARPRALAPF